MRSRSTRKQTASAPTRRPWFWRTGILLCLFTLLFDPGLWTAVWNGGLPHAWDGSGHYALAKLYSDSIFPDTFGWLPNYFAGMPLPNFYPPLFYWLVAALAHWSPLPFHAAFKIVLAASALSIPIAVWRLGRATTRRGAVAVLAAIAVFPLLFDKQSYHPLGLSYSSMFLVGIYTQPLGFLFAALWYESFLRARRRMQWLGSALLLALAFLSNFFTAALAMMLWASTSGCTLFRAFRARAPRARKRLRALTAGQAVTLPIALLLAGFWLFPVLSHALFLVSRPVQSPGNELTNPLLFVWYAAGAAGAVLWLRRPTAGALPVLLTLALSYGGLLIAGQEVLLPWFPLHPPRLLSCLNFLLAVPVGVALYKFAVRVGAWVRPRGYRHAAIPVAITGVLFLLAVRLAVKTPEYRLAFYSDSNGDFRRVEPILRFAQAHRDGRYIVEQVPFSAAGPALDSRALSAYLGMQGNEAGSQPFREASVSYLFLNPLTGAMSAGKDTYGLSSILAEDADFLAQDMETHLRQAELYRVRYLVVISSLAKRRMARLAPERYARYDFGPWSVFELKTPPQPEAVALARRPVLLLTSFSAKLTRRSDYHFLRLAQEEFLYPPGIPIAFHPDYRADRLPDPELFSALVVESYRYGDIHAAFDGIKQFSRKKPTVLLEADSPLFRLLRDRVTELGSVSIVRRVPANDDRWIGAGGRPFSYRRNAVRQTWLDVKASLGHALEAAPIGSAAGCEVVRIAGGQRIRCDGAGGQPAGVSVNTSFHPNWQAAGGRPVMMLGPSLIYTVVEGTTELRFRRSSWDIAALVVSAVVLAGVLAGMFFRRSALTSGRP